MRPQHLGEREHEVGGRRARRELADRAHADHDRLRQEHRLAEHRGFRLDTADAPPEHAEAVDHRRVRVGADERVGERHPVARRDDLARDARGSPGGRCRHPAARPAGRRTPAGPTGAGSTARRCAGTRTRCCARTPPGVRNRSTCTEWSITRSTGIDGSIAIGSAPARSAALRIAARSTTAGTPVKSCISTRPGMNAMSPAGPGQRGERAHVVVGDVAGTGAAQQVLEQDQHGLREPGEVACTSASTSSRHRSIGPSAVSNRPRAPARSLLTGASFLPHERCFHPPTRARRSVRPVVVDLGERLVEVVEQRLPLGIRRSSAEPVDVVLETLPLDEQQVSAPVLHARQQAQVAESRRCLDQVTCPRERVLELGLPAGRIWSTACSRITGSRRPRPRGRP